MADVTPARIKEFCTPTFAQGIRGLLAAFATSLWTVSSCFAGTEIEGQAEGLRLTVQNSSTQDVLNALAAKFPLTYKLPSELNHTVTGRYTGSIQRVLSRLLDGSSYILTTADDRLEITVFAASTAPANPSVPATAPMASVGPGSVMPTPMTGQQGPGLPQLAFPSRPPAVPTTAAPPPLVTYLPR